MFPDPGAAVKNTPYCRNPPRRSSKTGIWDRYFELRNEGMAHGAAAKALGLTTGQANMISARYSQECNTAANDYGPTPRQDSGHVKRLVAAGGFKSFG